MFVARGATAIDGTAVPETRRHVNAKDHSAQDAIAITRAAVPETRRSLNAKDHSAQGAIATKRSRCPRSSSLQCEEGASAPDSNRDHESSGATHARGVGSACVAGVVNHLHFKDSVDPSLFARAERDLAKAMRGIDGFERLEVVQSGERDVILIILADREETLDRIATDVGSPWMVEHVVTLRAGPPERHIGTTIASVTS
jgi:hypothetical protein